MNTFASIKNNSVMDERDFQAIQPLFSTAAEAGSYFKVLANPSATAPPSWYDIYRYATEKSKVWERQAATINSGAIDSDSEALDDIEDALRCSKFFDEIKELVDDKMMDACFKIAKENSIFNPWRSTYYPPTPKAMSIVLPSNDWVPTGGKLVCTERPTLSISSSECSAYHLKEIEFVGRVVSVEPICAGSYSLTVGRDTHLSLPGVAPDWMVPGVYVRVSLNHLKGGKIELLSEAASELIRKAEHAIQNPFAADYGTT